MDPQAKLLEKLQKKKKKIIKNAKKLGVKKIIIKNLKDTFVKDYVYPMIRGHAIYEGILGWLFGR